LGAECVDRRAAIAWSFAEPQQAWNHCELRKDFEKRGINLDETSHG
jgi:hypothetical protein